MKYVYYFNDDENDTEYGLYTIEEQAYLNEEETTKQGKDVYFCPDNATLCELPELEVNESARIKEDKTWEVVKNYRHQFVCDENLNISTVDYIGEIKDGYVLLTDEDKVKIQSDKLYYAVQGGKLVKNPDYEEEKAAEREKDFKEKFIETSLGWYRKTPKGYSSAIESVNTAFNVISVLGTLPAGTFIFYTKPDFTDAEQCTEDWLVAHQIKSDEMDTAAFGTFYQKLVTAWNSTEH